MSGSTQSGSGATQNPQQQNSLARSIISAQAIESAQPIFMQTQTGTIQPVLNIPPRNVGLLRGFWVEVNATMHDPSGTSTLTVFGPANLLSAINFQDLNNNQRLQTTGWHVAFIDAIRKGYPFPVGVMQNGPISFGKTFANYICSAPTTLPSTAPTSPNVNMLYYVPISYTKDDLRGAIYMGVVNATANLQLTINTAGFNAGTAGDKTLAVYGGSATASFDAVTIKVTQDYYDQLPQAQNGAPILPLLDLSTIYELKTTALTGMTVGQDFPIPYSNFRSFLSTFIIFDNAGTLNSGSDINYLALQAANFTNMLKADAGLWSQWTRDELMMDFPTGVYYLSHRRKPLNTNQYGNLQLILNASTVNAGASTLMGYEDFAQVNTVQLAGSLAAS